MRQVRFSSAVFALLASLSAARAEPVCDPPTEEGYRLVLSMEITGVTDGEPYQSGPDWIVERTTTVLPLCSYFTPVGSYSLRSYSLDPEKKTERVMLCHGDQRVGSYTGPCPPK
jgi:hypothetical protein